MEVKHTFHQMTLQRAVKCQISLYLVIVCRQCQLQVASLQGGICIDIAEIELAHVGIRKMSDGIERGGRGEEIKASSIHLCLTREDGAFCHRHEGCLHDAEQGTACASDGATVEGRGQPRNAGCASAAPESARKGSG